MVSDTDASLKLYRDVLGFSLAGRSENWGEEQEHLNNVFGVRLRITALRAPAGPGVEFHEYLTPGDGRAYPPDAKANDIVHWQTRLAVADTAAAEEALFKRRARFVSPGAVVLADPSLGFQKALLVRDPDGHALELTQDH